MINWVDITEFLPPPLKVVLFFVPDEALDFGFIRRGKNGEIQGHAKDALYTGVTHWAYVNEPNEVMED